MLWTVWAAGLLWVFMGQEQADVQMGTLMMCAAAIAMHFDERWRR